MDCCTFLLDKSARNSRFTIGAQRNFRAKNWQLLLDNDGTPSGFPSSERKLQSIENYRG